MFYIYDKQTKEFLREDKGQSDPIKGGVFTPPNCTTVKPLAKKDGFVCVVNESEWAYIEDNRGITVYDINTKLDSRVSYLGTIKEGFTKLVPSEFDVWNGTAWEIDLVAQATAQAKSINNAIQNHLDTKAQEFRYDNMMSARSYTGYTNAFQAEAQALATWASECWVVAGEIEADVEAGTREMPTVDEVLAELPVYGA